MRNSYFRYVRDVFGRGIGAVSVIEENGIFGLGFSMCNPDDKFDKSEARKIAGNRANQCFDDCPYNYYDMIDTFWADDFLSQAPKSKSRRDDVDMVFSTIMDIVDDITTDYARKYFKSIAKIVR